MASELSDKKVLLCVTGGIAAYKACEVASKLSQAGASVHVAMTAEAVRFVGAVTFQALTGRPVAPTLWQADEATPIPHIHLAQTADLILVAPATANILAKYACGIADEIVSTLLLAADPRRVYIAPAMNERMWNHPATQRNLKTVHDYGATYIGPASGWQACATVGVGRMAEAAEMIDAVKKSLLASRHG
jgi:phosphopantothenoylcysteine decarboxylase/phosphopantothenate--cysteine ligase